jgi:uncharacterized protein (DUF1810 family)
LVVLIKRSLPGIRYRVAYGSLHQMVRIKIQVFFGKKAKERVCRCLSVFVQVPWGKDWGQGCMQVVYWGMLWGAMPVKSWEQA